jgi:hypothetical protein
VPSRAAAPQLSGDMSRAVKTARTRLLPTTAAGTAIARSVKELRRVLGWRNGKPNCFPYPTSCTSSPRFQEDSGAMAHGVERSETTCAIAGDGPNAGTFQSRADSPGATTYFLCANSDWKAPDVDTCPGEKAATDAQWGDRAFERQYRDRMGLRWLMCSRARSTRGCLVCCPSEGST